jgi:hypothetical protein
MEYAAVGDSGHRDHLRGEHDRRDMVTPTAMANGHDVHFIAISDRVARLVRRYDMARRARLMELDGRCEWRSPVARSQLRATEEEDEPEGECQASP